MIFKIFFQCFVSYEKLLMFLISPNNDNKKWENIFYFSPFRRLK